MALWCKIGLLLAVTTYLPCNVHPLRCTFASTFYVFVEDVITLLLFIFLFTFLFTIWLKNLSWLPKTVWDIFSLKLIHISSKIDFFNRSQKCLLVFNGNSLFSRAGCSSFMPELLSAWLQLIQVRVSQRVFVIDWLNDWFIDYCSIFFLFPFQRHSVRKMLCNCYVMTF